MSRDLTRTLLRWIYVQGVPASIVLACPYSDVRRTAKDTLVVETRDCLTVADVGLISQLLASGVQEVHLAETCAEAASARQHLCEVFPRVSPWAEPRRKWGTRRPEVLFLGAIPLPRRMALGLTIIPQGPLSLGVEEQLRVADALGILRRTADVREVQPIPVNQGSAADSAKARALTASGCTACGICVNVCAHGALGIVESEGHADLLYRPAACQADLQCITVCPVDALVDHGPLSLLSLDGERVDLLASVPVARCGKCRARHNQVGESLCPSCRGREDIGFGTTANVEDLIRRANQFRKEHLISAPPQDVP